MVGREKGKQVGEVWKQQKDAEREREIGEEKGVKSPIVLFGVFSLVYLVI